MYIYIYIYICIFIYIYINVYIHIYIYMGFHKSGYPNMDGLWWIFLLKWMIWVYPYLRKPRYMIFTYIYIHQYISYMYKWLYICAYIYITYIHICNVYIYIHIHTHTCIYLYIYIKITQPRLWVSLGDAYAEPYQFAIQGICKKLKLMKFFQWFPRVVTFRGWFRTTCLWN